MPYYKGTKKPLLAQDEEIKWLLRDEFATANQVMSDAFTTFSNTWLQGGTWTSDGTYVANTPVLGGDLWDAPAAAFTSGTYAWTVYGTNTIANVDNALQITFVSSVNGAYNYLRNASNISADLVVYMWYKFTVDAKINSGSGYISVLGIYAWNSDTLIETELTPKHITFRASGTTDMVAKVIIGAGQVITIDNTSLKPIPTSSLFTNLQLSTAETTVSQLIHARTAGTQIGLLLNADRSFAATFNGNHALNATVIALNNVTAAITTSDTLTIGSTIYTIASTTGGSNVAYNASTHTQTVTISSGLVGGVSSGDKLGIDYASWNGTLVYFDGAGNVKTDEIKAGVYTNRSSTAVTFVADKSLVVQKTGSTYYVSYNSTAVVTVTTVDAAAMAGTYFGMFSTYAANTVDSITFSNTVNATSAEPGPGTRTVVDSESKLSISGGKLVCTGGKASAGYGDPGLWENAITRVAGIIGICSIISSSGTVRIGFDTNQSGIVGDAFVSLSGTNLLIALNSSGISAGAISNSETYKLGFAIRVTGTFYFIKGGSFTIWTLIGVNNNNTPGIIYPNIGNYDSAFSSSFFRFPTTLWLPTPLLSDGFGSTFGSSDGLGHAEGIAIGIGSGGGGQLWTDAGTWATGSGYVANTPVLGVEKVLNNTFDSDLSEWDLTPASGTIAWDAGTIKFTQSASSENLYASQDIATAAGVWYYFSASVVTNSTYCRLLLGSVKNGQQSIVGPASASGTSTLIVTAKSISTTLWASFLDGNPATKISNWDNATLKKIPNSSLFTNLQLSTTDVYVEQVIHVRTDGTQVGLALNLDRSFAAKAASTASAGQAVIALKNVTGVGGVGLSTSDTITVNGIIYTIASTTGGSNVAYNDTAKTQTVTLGANLGADVATDAKVGLDWASWNGTLIYFDGTGNIKTDEVKAGVYTNRSSTAVTFVADKRLIVRKTGTEYRIFFNEAAVVTVTTVDAAAQAGLYHGMFSTYVDNTIDSIVVYPTGSSGDQHSFLNRFSQD